MSWESKVSGAAKALVIEGDSFKELKATLTELEITDKEEEAAKSLVGVVGLEENEEEVAREGISVVVIEDTAILNLSLLHLCEQWNYLAICEIIQLFSSSNLVKE